MIAADESFDGTFPFPPRFFQAPGFAMHYVDEGVGEPIICLHGEPTWGYLYRKFIGPLSRTNRVVVPDHMGFGKSETPPDADYSLKSHVTNLAALVEELDLTDITLVMQDWGGPIGMGYAIRNPERIKRLVLMNTLSGYGGGAAFDPADPTPWFAWIGEARSRGTYEAVLSELGTVIVSIMRLIGFENTSVVNRTWEAAYAAPFPDAAACKAAVEFPLDAFDVARIAEFVMDGFGGVEAIKAKPAILLEGMADRAIDPAGAIADFQGLWPDSPIVELEGVGHFCQEDAPETLVALIQAFLQEHP